MLCAWQLWASKLMNCGFRDKKIILTNKLSPAEAMINGMKFVKHEKPHGMLTVWLEFQLSFLLHYMKVSFSCLVSLLFCNLNPKLSYLPSRWVETKTPGKLFRIWSPLTFTKDENHLKPFIRLHSLSSIHPLLTTISRYNRCWRCENIPLHVFLLTIHIRRQTYRFSCLTQRWFSIESLRSTQGIRPKWFHILHKLRFEKGGRHGN